MKHKGHINIPTRALMIAVNISSCLNAKTSATLKQMALLALNKSSYGAGLKNPAGPCWGQARAVGKAVKFIYIRKKY
jgi:hypothetical protein